MPLPPLIAPWVLGMDDFALYRDAYGTLLIDAIIRLPLRLWEGVMPNDSAGGCVSTRVSRSPAATAR
ncbi:hypothetical protein DN051_43965 (plasmid) [Streptomyces cadmiisoli]|uniref:Uncharacterized protein n=1 Tax=Streptomyces cadmiisoli TaxID=2184053 RepID=A0A2Z4JF44_9ACTN|nr:hypothetical protein DN051_43965 [Streptomyces cadmiisoli]